MSTMPTPTVPFTSHDTMTIERLYRAPVAAVFGAWSDAAAKRIWFTGSSAEGFYSLDFRVGGHEVSRATLPGSGTIYTYDAEYQDIVSDARIVYTNHMLRGDRRISVSLTCVEFTSEGGGTRIVLTEHGIYLDGEDTPESRRRGIEDQFAALARHVNR